MIDESLRRFGLRPAADDLDRIREVLLAQQRLDQQDQNTELMRLCCVQLFNAGAVEDSLTIWRAKRSSWDAHCALDVQLLCGAGLDATKAYLADDGSEEATAALAYLRDCEAAGDFAGFTVAEQARWYDEYFGP